MTRSTLTPPLKKTARLSSESESFKTLSLSEQTEIPLAPHPGAFAVARAHHIHEGVDLYGQDGDPVFAMEDGEVVFNGPFTGPKAGSPHWLDTDAVGVSGSRGVIFYGEIEAETLRVGDRVQAGDRLGHLSRVLRNDKGRPLHMLHIELYEPGVHESCGIWDKGQPRPKGLLDPTPMLKEALGLELASNGPTSPPSRLAP